MNRIYTAIICTLASFAGSVFGMDHLSQLSPETVRALHEYRRLCKDQPQEADDYLNKQLENNRAPALVFELGLLLSTQGKQEAAIACFQEVLEKEPEFPNAASNLGQLSAATGKHKEAAAILSQLAQNSPLTATQHLLLGRSYLALGNAVSAENSLRQALVGFPDDTNARLSLGLALYKQARYSAAEATAQAILKVEPGNESAWTLVANSRLMSNRPDAAIDALEAAVRLSQSPKAELLLTLGDLYLQQKLPEQAAATYQKAAAGELSPKRQLSLAQSLFHAGDLQSAEKMSKKLVAVNQELAEAHALLGFIELGRKNSNGAKRHFEQTLESNPLHGDALIALGDIAARDKDIPAAIARYRSARAIETHERQALEAEVDLLLREERFAEGLEILKQLQRSSPSPHWLDLMREVQARLR